MSKLNTVKNGKGDKPRITKYSKFWENFDLIKGFKSDTIKRGKQLEKADKIQN